MDIHREDEHPVDILKAEHRVILAVLSAAERELDRMGGELKSPFWLNVADFLANFADGYHHAKEEDLLFPSLIDQGMPADNSPVAVMLEEHGQGRELRQRLQEAATAGDTEAVADSARSLIGLLRAHIEKEDLILFEMARNILGADQVAALGRGFASVARDQGGHSTHVGLAERLCDEAGVDFCCRRS